MNRKQRRGQRRAIVSGYAKTKGWVDAPREAIQRMLTKHPACRQIKRFVYSSSHSVQVYSVVCDIGIVTHLIIRRHDEKPERDWSTLQAIKNELCGEEALAVEVFPPQAEVVDQANLYHLWVMPDGYRLPFGLDRPGGGMVNSP